MLLTGFFALGAMGSLSACTAPIDGMIGITTDGSGQPSVVLQSCQQHVGGVTLYWSDDPAGSDSSHARLAEWKLPTGYGSPLQWPLLSAKPDGVTILKKPTALVPGRIYSIYGWTRESPYYSATGPDFKAEDIVGLQSGDVLIGDLFGGKDPRAPIRVSLAKFRQLACASS